VDHHPGAVRIFISAKDRKPRARRRGHELRDQHRFFGADAALEAVPQVEERLHSGARRNARPEPLANERSPRNDALEVASEDLGILDASWKDGDDVPRFSDETVGALANGVDLARFHLGERGMMSFFDLTPSPREKDDAVARIESETDFSAAQHTVFGRRQYIRLC
jgi:hypothetical protein